MAEGPIVAPVEAGAEALDELAERLQHTDVSTSDSGCVQRFSHNAAWSDMPQVDVPEHVAACRLTLEQKYELCRSVGTECIQEDELRNLLEKKPNPIAYDGFEPSGRMHIAQVRP